MNGPHSKTVDAIKELRLRSWARTNYAPPPERKPTWHPVVLDEMARRDAEISASYQSVTGLSFTDMPDVEDWPLWPAPSQPLPAIAYEVVVPAAPATSMILQSESKTTSTTAAQSSTTPLSPAQVQARDERRQAYVPLMPTGIRVYHNGHAHQADPNILRHLAESERPSRVERY